MNESQNGNSLFLTLNSIEKLQEALKKVSKPFGKKLLEKTVMVFNEQEW